ncbi:hypothetical protein RU639_003182 [Aspergillus parasiticus]
MAYVLTKDDLDCGSDRLNEMSTYERDVLEHYSPNNVICGAIWGGSECPLTAVIEVKSTQNVNILLDAGADINGISAEDLSDYSARFLRGRDASVDTSSFASVPFRAQLLATAKAKGVEYQTAPLTPAELNERRLGFPGFWTESNVPGQRLRMATALTSLEVAAKFGCEEIFEILYKAGAEDSSWRVSTATQEDSLLEIPSEAPLFALSVSSPMHQAIASGHRSMLDKLLNAYNYCPNYRPLVAPTVGVPAVTWQSRACVNALATCSPIRAFPLICARQSLRCIRCTSPQRVGRTVLGHTLLHVAALPLTGYQVVRNKPVIERSIHCARPLDSTWRQSLKPSPLHLEYPRHSRPPYINEEKQYKHVPMTDAEQVAQLATIALLLRRGGLDVQAQDIDGNTALHYLAATLNVGDETVELGLTPKQLAEEKLADNCKDA